MTTVADQIVQRLADWGVGRVFGYSGDGINGVLDALRRSDAGIEFVQARHEENAAFMAVGQAKYDGGAGVVISTQGPGAIHLLNGLYDAKLDHAPVVALIGQQHRSTLGSGYMQEVDLRTLFADVASAYITQVASPEQVPLAIDRAFRNALATRQPAVVILPHDVQSAEASDVEQSHGVVRTGAVFEPPLVTPPAERLDEAAARLRRAQRPMILAGRGAASCGDALAELATRIRAGVVTSLLGKPYIDESLRHAAGTMGHLGTTASAELLTACDLLLIVGSNDPWTEYYPAPGQAAVIQIDVDPRMIGNRLPVDVGIVGDAGAAIRGLAERVEERAEDEWWARVRDAVDRWRQTAERRAAVQAEPLNPEAAVRALNAHVPDDARIALDVGSIVYWYARQLRLPRGVPAHVSGTLATMGCGVPYGLAAKLGAPDRPVVVLAGDGGMQMTGVAELITVAARWRDWTDPRFVVAVFENRDLAEVSWEQREMEGAPRFAETQDLPEFAYAEYARMLGLGGEVVDDADDLDAAWGRAFASDRPYVLHLRTDPAVPLLPPAASSPDAAEEMRSALRAEVEAGGPQGERALRLLDAYLDMPAT
ncbi:thiamine pyrophosphate-requiring protein [Microbacterium sp. JZ31]|uniref:thiamine pyrophosphate-requiring protein n=1 Tax=Microbacterium sp. JZ31 TaxID=1906274 RepID=UPI00193214C7|nr:thiamine pyrophosphate-requiring protein [Microbacterium sp. JZ31]